MGGHLLSVLPSSQRDPGEGGTRMSPPIQLQRIPKRKTTKPATVRALFWWVSCVCFFTGCAGLIARCT